MRVGGRAGGFSLIEVVIATALLLMAVVSVSATVSQAARTESVVTVRTQAQEALDAEVQHLSALPYFVRTVAADGVGDGAGSDVEELFPHALPARNTPDAYYCADAAAADYGAFISVVVRDDITIRRTARFVSGLVPGSACDPDCLYAWSVWSADAPPAPALRVTLTVAGPGAGSGRSVVLTALRPSVEPSTDSPGASPNGA